MLVTRNLLGLFNGVSQQPAAIRLDSQCEDQVNAVSSIVDGLWNRPNTEFVKQITDTTPDDAFVHFINRDTSERYIAVFTGDGNNPINVYDLLGNKQTVRYGHLDANLVFTADNAVKAYAAVASPNRNLKATTMADYTIVTNRTKVTAMLPTVSPVNDRTFFIVVSRGIPSCDYKVWVNNGVVAQYATGPTDANTWKTDAVAWNLYYLLNQNLTPAGWTVGMTDSNTVYLIAPTTIAVPTIISSDSWGNQAMRIIDGKTQKFSDLPAQLIEGITIEIAGDSNNKFGKYYVKQVGSVWKETPKLGIKNNLDPSTMPHRLVRTAVGEFTFSDCIWEPRKVGDEDTAPNPSFIGSTINEVFFYANRLGILSGENIIMSRTGLFFNFYPSSALDILEDDPIDIAVAVREVAHLHHAIPFSTNLMLLAESHQFILSNGEQALTSKNASPNLSTSYYCSRHCKPVGIGSNVYFCEPNGENSIIREYYVQPDTLTNEAADITAHIPQYIPKNLTKLIGSSSSDMLFALSEDDRKTLYVYKFLWNGADKAQSAWSKWTFPDDIVSIEMHENILYILQRSGSTLLLNKINLSQKPTGTLPFRVHLDKLVKLTGVYDAVADRTTWTLPYTDAAPITEFTLVDSVTGLELAAARKDSNTTISVGGNWTAKQYYIGRRYTMRYQFSDQYHKVGDKAVAALDAEMYIKRMTIGYKDSGYFRVETTPKGRPAGMITKHVGITIGTSKFGTPSITTGETNVFPLCNARGSKIEIINDTYLPTRIHGVSIMSNIAMISAEV